MQEKLEDLNSFINAIKFTIQIQLNLFDQSSGFSQKNHLNFG